MSLSFFNEKIYKHSCCVHVRWNPLGHATIRSDLLKPVGTRSDLSRPVRTCRNTLQPVETRYNPFRPVGTRLHHPMNFLFSIFYFIPQKNSASADGVLYKGNISKIKIKIKIKINFWYWGGGATTNAPRKDFTNTINTIKIFKSSNLQNLCNLPSYYRLNSVYTAQNY